jgi:hypothetical protein
VTVEHEEGHVELANSRWTDAFRDKPVLTALLAAFVAEVQELEDSAETLRTLRLLDNSEGVQLDTYGAIVGLERLGLGDDDYRAMLKIWVYANRAHGGGDNVLYVVAAALGEDFDFQLIEHYPAAMLVELFSPLEIDEATVARLVKRVRQGGVNTQITWTSEEEADVFLFATGDDYEDSTTQGAGDDAQTTGGHLAGVEQA